MATAQGDTLHHTKDTAVKAELSYTHVFEHHDLQVQHTSGILLDKKEMVWPVFVFTAGFILLVLIRTTSSKRFFMILKAIFTLGASKQLMREDYRLNKGSAVLFSIVFVLHFAFFLFVLNRYFGYIHYSFNPFLFYLVLAGAIILIYAFKIAVSKLFASLLLARNETEEYIFNIFMSTNAAGLFLFPVIVCSEYSQLPLHYFIYGGIFLLLAFYLIRVFKGIAVAYVSGRFSVFHLFLYFCTLELLPLIVIIKLLMSRIL